MTTIKAKIIYETKSFRIIEKKESYAFKNSYLNFIIESYDGEDSLGNDRWKRVYQTFIDKEREVLDQKATDFIFSILPIILRSYSHKISANKVLELQIKDLHSADKINEKTNSI